VSEFPIGRRTVGLDHPTYFVADVAANHDGDLDRARALVGLAAEAGADGIKFQHFAADTIVSGKGFEQVGSVGHQAAWRRSIVDVYRAAEVPLDWTQGLVDACADAGVEFLTAPYDPSFIGPLDPYVAAWKVGSGDLTWHAHIEAMARTGKPLLLATGASDLHEVRAAVAVALRHTDELVVMQCNTNYTGSVENFHHIALNVLRTYADLFPTAVLGLSDHTPGHATVLGAVTLGARVIEKHFTDDPSREGPDHPFSMDPVAWRDMVDRTRELEAALGTGEKRVMDNERETVVVQRRAVRAARALPAGTVLASDDVAYLRPCPTDACPPHRVGELVGRSLRTAIAEGDVIRIEDVT
jgi:N-acetylneuraminate synthase